MAAIKPSTPSILAKEDYRPEGFKWLTLKRITWQDPNGRTRFWESAERTTRPAGGVDAVAVVARVSGRGAPPQLVVIKQYRPPVAASCLELPAGLIDPGESAEQAATRELAEETGHRGALVSLTPACVSDPGMSNANMQVALVDVDVDAPENAAVRAAPEDGEFIEVELAPWDGLLGWLLAKKRKEGVEIDARLMAFALGLHHGAAAAAVAAPALEAVAGPGAANAQGASLRAGPVAALAARGAATPFGSPIAQMDGGISRSSSMQTDVAKAESPRGRGAAGAGGAAAAAVRSRLRSVHSDSQSAAGAVRRWLDGRFVAGMLAATMLGLLLNALQQ